MRVDDYKIAGAGSPAELENSVKKLLLDGFVPIGGVVFTQTPSPDSVPRYWYLQAMEYSER